MRIEKAGAEMAPIAHSGKRSRSAANQELRKAAQDEFVSSRAEMRSLQGTLNASLVLDARGINKKENDFRVRSSVAGPDGTLFVLYSTPTTYDGRTKSTGYLAAVSPGGAVQWESPVEEEGACEVKAGPDGTVFVKTGEHLRALNPDGTLKFAHAFEGGVREHWLDSSGNHYFVSESNKELYGVDKDGRKKELPPELKGLRCEEAIQTSTDVLYARDGSTLRILDLKSGTKTGEMTYKDPVESKANFSRSIKAFDVDAGGNVRLFINNTTAIPAPPMHDDFHFGIGGFRRWGGMPHPPMDDNFYRETYVTDLSVERLDARGKVLWKAGSLGSDPLKASLPDGTVLYTNNRDEMVPNPEYQLNPQPDSMHYAPREIPSGKIYVGTITADGTQNEKKFKVEGRVSALAGRPESGTVIIAHGEDRLTEFSADGTALKSQTVPTKGLRLEGPAGESAVLLKDAEGRNAYCFDMESGKLSPLTDRDFDYSFRVVGRESAKAAAKGPGEAPPTLEDSKEWVSIGGVKLGKKKLQS